MEIDLALLADAATVDGSGKLNILGVFDRLTAAHFPAQHGRISLVLRFQATVQDAGRHQIQIFPWGIRGREPAVEVIHGRFSYSGGQFPQVFLRSPG